MKRTTFHLYYSKERKRWETSVGGMIVGVSHHTKIETLRWLRETCEDLWESCAVPCEIVVHNKTTGQVTAAGKSTYGNDPKRSKG